MTDLEAQAMNTNVDPDAATIRIPRHELKELVRALVRSVEILRSTVDDDKEDEARSQEHEMQSILQSAPSTTTSSDRLRSQDNAVDGDADCQRDPNTSKVAVATAEQVVSWRKETLTAFEERRAGRGISRHLSVDPWRLLSCLDWSYYGIMYTLAASLPDAARSKRQIPGIIQYYSDHSDLRREVQKLVFYGLSRWWWCNGWPTDEPSIRTRGVLDMAPWVALIGMRLPSFVNGEEVDKTGADKLRSLAVLTVLLQMPQANVFSDQHAQEKEGSFWGDRLTVGRVLDECYRHRVLEEPDSTADDDVLKSQVKDLVRAMKLINLWYFFSYCYPNSVEPRNVRSMNVSSLCMHLRVDEDWHRLPRSSDATFRCQEMSLELLRKVGKIKVRWTEFLDEHLTLDIEDLTLSVFWFGFAIKANPIFHIGCGSRFMYCHKFNSSHSHIFDELSKTYSLLFRSRADTYKDNLREYGLLPIPQWVRVCYGGDGGTLSSRTARDMSYFVKSEEPWLSDIKYHLADTASKRLSATEWFEDYVIWSNRLRELKAYLDDQKPKGMYGLWTDRRDTLQWYTFWAVIIVGSVGLSLSFFGLIVSIVQTIGTFESRS